MRVAGMATVVTMTAVRIRTGFTISPPSTARPISKHHLLQLGLLDKPFPERFRMFVEHEAFIVVEDVPAAQTHLAGKLAGSPACVTKEDAQVRRLPSLGQCACDALLRSEE